MSGAVLAIAFGEPPEPDPPAVINYLETIFYENMAIEGDMPEAVARERAATLAEDRAPALLDEYRAIGGSPLQDHLRGHVERLDAELDSRGYDAIVREATQYFEPSIESAVASLAEEAPETVVVLPLYPLCGPSTTVTAIEQAVAEIRGQPGWEPALAPISGWHRHPRYYRLRAETVRSYVEGAEVDLADPTTELVLSAHGTPVSYLEGGSRYDRYVGEFSAALAALLGVETYTLGYQNHESREVPWTEPAIEDAIASIEADRIVVDPISFIHEQSETRAELDIELAAEAAELGFEFHRVPVPHDHPDLPGVLADLVEPALAGFDDATYGYRPCQCATTPGTRCLCAPLTGRV